MRTRLPLALLGAVAVIVLGGCPSVGAPSAPAAPAMHAVLAGGHVAEGVLLTAHPRPVTPLPLAVPTLRASLGDRPARRAIAQPRPRSRQRFTVPPTAIRGPPA